jgi:AmmeMemoRadiSam system protein A
MELIYLNDSALSLLPEHQTQLLQLARESIRKGLHKETFVVTPADYPAPLRAMRASFVTLEVDRKLHGCIGTLEARQSLVEDVVSNAHGAAFRDTRFPALTPSEFEQVDIHISILSPLEAVKFASEEDLIAKLRPGIDGLMIEEGMHRGTFLPAVWESVPEPREFLRCLKVKAGLKADHWSNRIVVRRYSAESVP